MKTARHITRLGDTVHILTPENSRRWTASTFVGNSVSATLTSMLPVHRSLIRLFRRTKRDILGLGSHLRTGCYCNQQRSVLPFHMNKNTDQSSISYFHDDGQLRGKGRVQYLPSPEQRAQLLPLCSQKVQREVENLSAA